MKERPIIFNAEMVNAILSGSKTQTRRIVKDQRVGDMWSVKPAENSSFERHSHDWWLPTGTKPYSALACPFGKIGDRLWVRETFCPVNDDSEQWIDYRATPRYEYSHPAGWDCDPTDPEALKWRPSIHMPRWASRITLEITGVRVERLNSISSVDAKAEGYPAEREADGGHHDAWLWYRSLWESIYGKESWQANSWVWVIEFKRVEAN